MSHEFGGAVTKNYTYDQFGSVTQLQKVISGATYTTSYAYNLASELTSITYPSGRVVQQNVDTIGRLSSVVGTLNSVSTTYASSFGYNTAQQVNGFNYGNNINAAFGYSADRLQLTCLDYSTTNRNGTCAHDATTKFGLSYSYGSAGSNNGQITGITDSVDNGRSATYGYDALHRLTSATTTGSTAYPQWGLSMTYDRYGNRSAQSVTAGTGVPANSVTIDATKNRLTGAPYLYDANGNMTNDGNNTLAYDAENHAVTAAGATYTYDGNGLRVKKVSGASTTVYIFSGSKVIAEYDNGAIPASPSREYIYSGGALLAKIDSSGTKYYHQDHLSNRLVTDSTGTVTAQMGHYPFGESWYNASNDKLLFTSYERDSESGNDYALARYSINRLGRFSSPDPLSGSTSDPQSLNRYPYARLDPANLIDPTGEIWACTTTIAGPGDHGETTCTWYPDPVDSSSFECNGDACLPPIIIGGRLLIERRNASGNCPPPLICTSGNSSTPLVQPQITNGDGQLCTPSVFNPSCKPPSCPAVFVNAATGADLGLPPDADQAAKAAAAAAATNRIVTRGLVKPLASSYVRGALLVGDVAADLLSLGPILIQELVGFKAEVKAWRAGTCTTIWSKP